MKLGNFSIAAFERSLFLRIMFIKIFIFLFNFAFYSLINIRTVSVDNLKNKQHISKKMRLKNVIALLAVLALFKE